MNYNFNKKVALVTGSSRGIGLSIGLALYEMGCVVILNSRNIKDLKIILKGKNSRLLAIDADVTKKSGITKIREFLHKKNLSLDLLICNYGDGKSPVEKTYDINEWKRVFDINFFSSINILFEFITDLRKNKGNCLFISSICGLAALNAPITYSVAKSAINYSVKNLANMLGKDGIRINAISPGNILHKGSVWEKKINENEKEVKKMIKNNVPLNKFGSPKDISSAAIFLLSENASFITGSNLVVDGGQLKTVEA